MALDLTALTRPPSPMATPWWRASGLRAFRLRGWRRSAVVGGCLSVVAAAAVSHVGKIDLALMLPLCLVVLVAAVTLTAVARYTVFIAAGLSFLLAAAPGPEFGSSPVLVGGLATGVAFLVVLERAWPRSQIDTADGATMLAELRDRLHQHGQLPDLPHGWHADSSIQAAQGEAFGGDFLVTQLDDDVLDVLLVDVAGKGMTTGSRAVTLANAFAGLMGVTSADELLPAANRFIDRQGGPDMLATAVHVRLDLATGCYSVGNAGHPAAMHFQSGRGRWDATDRARGVMLGAVGPELASYTCEHGRLNHGDALLLYSDGVIEDRRYALDRGLDRMLGVADREVALPGAGSAARICATAMGGRSDDRSVVLIRRD